MSNTQNDLIKVKKGNLETFILNNLVDRYKANGWKVVKDSEDTPKITDEAEQIISEVLDTKQAAQNRQKNLNSDNIMGAKTIVATELRKEGNKTFSDGLIKE